MKTKKTCYFDLISFFYEITFEGRNAEENIRKSFREEEKLILENSFENFLKLEEDPFVSFDDQVKELLTLAGNIYLFQPFYEGNKKVISTMLLYYLQWNEYSLKEETSLMEKIPCFYQPNEEISSFQIESFKSILKEKKRNIPVFEKKRYASNGR